MATLEESTILVDDMDRKIVRITQLRWVEALFADAQNCLVSPASWEDKLENQLLNGVYARNRWENSFPTRQSLSFRTIQEHWFGQCWSYSLESDGLWQIYSPRQNCIDPPSDVTRLGVQLFSTPARLIHPLIEASALRANAHAFIGGVKYAGQKEIKDLLIAMGPSLMSLVETLNSDDGIELKRNLALTLLAKRNSFKHEDEIRLLWYVPDSATDKISYAIDPAQMITRIVLDPRLADNEELTIRRRLEPLVESIPIEKSDIHSPFAGNELPLDDV